MICIHTIIIIYMIYILNMVFYLKTYKIFNIWVGKNCQNKQHNMDINIVDWDCHMPAMFNI